MFYFFSIRTRIQRAPRLWVFILVENFARYTRINTVHVNRNAVALALLNWHSLRHALWRRVRSIVLTLELYVLSQLFVAMGNHLSFNCIFFLVIFFLDQAHERKLHTDNNTDFFQQTGNWSKSNNLITLKMDLFQCIYCLHLSTIKMGNCNYEIRRSSWCTDVSVSWSTPPFPTVSLWPREQI